MTDSEGGPVEDRKQTILEQLGGLTGLVASTLPVLVFVPVNSIFDSLAAAIWSALAVALGSWSGGW